MLSTNSAAVAQRRVTVAGRGDRPPALVGGRPRASPRMTEVEARGPHSVAEVATASAAWRHRVRRRGKPHLRQSSCGGGGSSRRCQGRPVRRHPAVETASVGYEGNLSRRAPQSTLLDPVYIVGPKQHPKGSLRLHVVRRRHGASIERHSRVKVAESLTRRPEEVECGCQHQRPRGGRRGPACCGASTASTASSSSTAERWRRSRGEAARRRARAWKRRAAARRDDEDAAKALARSTRREGGAM